MADLALPMPAAAGATRRQGSPLSRRFNDLRFAMKLGALVAALLALLCTLGVLSIMRLGSVADQSTAIALGQHHTSLVGDMRYDVAQSVGTLRRIVITDSPTQSAQYLAEMKGFDAAFRRSFTPYAAAADAGRQQRLVDQLESSWSQFLTLRTATLLPLALGDDGAAYVKVADSQSKPLLAKVTGSLSALDAMEERDGAAGASTAAATYRSGRFAILGLIGIALLLGAALGFVVSRSVLRPLGRVQEVLKALADGDLTRHAEVDSHDELGVMARSLNQAVDSLRSTVAMMAGNAHALAAASEQLSTTSHQIASSAEQTSAQAGVVASAAEQVSANVQTVAAGTEEMGASIREIAQNAADAARVAAHAVTVAASTNETVSKLGDSSQEISQVIKVITSIAAQTNLLALNATIEAARAGEAGRGFAVVANEVKDLAQETAKATEDISRRIEAIQTDTGGAVAAIGEISEVIGRINDYQNTIAAAVEEQTATTNEMARNVTEAATGSQEIAANVVGVASAAEITTTGVGESQRAAADLARMSSELQALVGQFRH
jgi:methyl-accepting chemotaxis protein